ncbi:hypothetical protein B484DRAFT_480686, partial [Ochromonadaceae sp. CCMP2298]
MSRRSTPSKVSVGGRPGSAAPRARPGSLVKQQPKQPEKKQEKENRPRPKQAWNDYLTDGDRFRDPVKVQVRARQMLSKHNCLVDVPAGGGAGGDGVGAGAGGGVRGERQTQTPTQTPTQTLMTQGRPPSAPRVASALKRAGATPRMAKDSVNSGRGDKIDRGSSRDRGGSDRDRGDGGSGGRGYPASRLAFDSDADADSVDDMESEGGAVVGVGVRGTKGRTSAIPVTTNTVSNKENSVTNTANLSNTEAETLRQMGAQVVALFAELRYYEEVSGKRSIVDTDK